MKISQKRKKWDCGGTFTKPEKWKKAQIDFLYNLKSDYFKKLNFLEFFNYGTACSSVIPKKIRKTVVRSLKKDICGINMQPLIRNGVPIHLQLAFVKKESDFDWLAKPPRKNYLKSYLLKDRHHHSDILKLLKVHGNNINKKQTIHWRPEPGLKTPVDFIGWYINKTKQDTKNF